MDYRIKKDKSYSSYAKAIKQLNLKFMSINEAIGKSGKINVFENDSLVSEHHPLKADMKLSEKKGIGNGQEYVVDSKGAELKYDNKEGKEEDGFGDNVADSTAEKDVEKVKLSENETAIDSMITGEEVIEERMLRKYDVIDTTDNDKVVSKEPMGYDSALELARKLNQTKQGHKIKPEIPYGDFTKGSRVGSVYEEKAPIKKGFSIARAIQEMDEVIDSIATEDDKINDIIESLGETEKAIMMEALKKKD